VRSWRSSLLFLSLFTTACGGKFDYYLFSLSWSPEYCHSHPEAVECGEGKHYGFIVHGLWPQFNNGRYPEHCSDAGAVSAPASLHEIMPNEIMPDPGLIAHEWKTHGTCTGVSSSEYFNLIRSVLSRSGFQIS
jgi:ribonuclease T2